MPLNDNGLNACLVGGLTDVAQYLSVHTGDPSTIGANESTAARQLVAWGSPAAGVISLSGAEAFTGGAASGACTHFGLWSAASGGTFYGGDPLTGDQTFNAAGEYTVNDVDVTVTSP